MSGSQLGSTLAEARERALNSSRRHIRLAQSLQAPTVVVRGCEVEDPALAARSHELSGQLETVHPDDREALHEEIRTHVQKVQKKSHRQIEHFCRSLHSLRREFPETRIALEPGVHFNDILNYESVQWILDDLSKESVGYWHDTGRIHQRSTAGLPNQGDWLDSFAGKMFGVHLGDYAEHVAEMPPGQGEVDFKLVAEYLPTDIARVLEVNPRHGRAEILAAVAFLLDKGL